MASKDDLHAQIESRDQKRLYSWYRDGSITVYNEDGETEIATRYVYDSLWWKEFISGIEGEEYEWFDLEFLREQKKARRRYKKGPLTLAEKHLIGMQMAEEIEIRREKLKAQLVKVK